MVSSQKKAASPQFDDTIAAIITPPGEGGVAAIRLAGRLCLSILKTHFKPAVIKSSKKIVPFMMRYGHFIRRGETKATDEIMAVYMPAGRSYTGCDQVELYCHGGPQVVKLILDELLASGARAAEPGEFTKLAFLSGRIDLSHAEAVAEIIAANTESSYEAAREHLVGHYSEYVEKLRDDLVGIVAEVEASIDFPEEEIESAERASLLFSIDEIRSSLVTLSDSYRGGRIIKEGFRIAIAGRPNAGKSSLFNLLLRQQRAIVATTAGTTRDYLSEWIDLEGYAVNIVDTAGLRGKGGAIEKAGQESAQRIISKSDLILWMIDLAEANWSKQLTSDLKMLGSTPIMVTGNKIDMCDNHHLQVKSYDGEIICVSCKTGKGIKDLKRTLVALVSENLPDLTSGVVVTSARHKSKLTSATRHILTARKKIADSVELELAAFDLRQAVADLDEITGRIYTEEILGRIFSKFCVGK